MKRLEDKEDCEAKSCEAWAGIQDLLERLWWSRIWVYQEAAAPTKNAAALSSGFLEIKFDKAFAVNQYSF